MQWEFKDEELSSIWKGHGKHHNGGESEEILRKKVTLLGRKSSEGGNDVQVENTGWM